MTVITRFSVRSALHSSRNERLAPPEGEGVQDDLNLELFFMVAPPLQESLGLYPPSLLMNFGEDVFASTSGERGETLSQDH